jgi:NmrA-like family
LRKNFFRSFSIETIFAFGKLRCGMGPGLQIHVGARKFCIREHGVRVFVLGGTGVIGVLIVRELINRGHDVRALTRSDISAAKLSQFGATATAATFPSPRIGLRNSRASTRSFTPPAISPPTWAQIGRAASPSQMGR